MASLLNCTRCQVALSPGLRICNACGQRLTVIPSGLPAQSVVNMAPIDIHYQLIPVGFWRRTGAFCIDLLILVPSVYIFQQFIPLIAGFIFWWLYFSIFESSGWHATPGKRILGIEVTDVNGVHLRFGRSSLRFVGRLLSTAPVFLGFVLAAFTQNKQTLHDLIANTLVIKSR